MRQISRFLVCEKAGNLAPGPLLPRAPLFAAQSFPRPSPARFEFWTLCNPFNLSATRCVPDLSQTSLRQLGHLIDVRRLLTFLVRDLIHTADLVFDHCFRCLFQLARGRLIVRSFPKRRILETTDCNPPEEFIASDFPRREPRTALRIMFQRWCLSHCTQSAHARRFAPSIRISRRHEYTRPRIHE